MAFHIEITAEAENDLDRIRPFHREQILDEIEAQLRFTPMQVSRSRIKRLRLIDSPAFRLRVDEYRIYYDVDETTMIVVILRVLSKQDSQNYLQERE
jgi:mRNA-degrading endonuclease RelE of RelBE toxin-antitoxin system